MSTYYMLEQLDVSQKLSNFILTIKLINRCYHYPEFILTLRS